MPRRLTDDHFVKGSTIALRAGTGDRVMFFRDGDYIGAEDEARRWIQNGAFSVLVYASHPKIGKGEERLITVFSVGHADV